MEFIKSTRQMVSAYFCIALLKYILDRFGLFVNRVAVFLCCLRFYALLSFYLYYKKLSQTSPQNVRLRPRMAETAKKFFVLLNLRQINKS
jgi:hypothetical protein